MSLVKKPCAYCGTTFVPRTKGHVIPDSLYPTEASPLIQRITVPECLQCKAKWEDAEPQFKHVLLSIRNPDAIEWDPRMWSMIRAFREADGKRRFHDLMARAVRVGDGPSAREVVYPAKDPAFNLILRRIVRGLSHRHDVGTAIPDDNVLADAMRWQIPPAFEREISWHELGSGFVRYGFQRLDDTLLKSFWLLTFFRRIEFFGAVCTTGEGAARRAAT